MKFFRFACEYTSDQGIFTLHAIGLVISNFILYEATRVFLKWLCNKGAYRLVLCGKFTESNMRYVSSASKNKQPKN
jgi:hypothetical protein